jgi:hypothetical protein
MHHGYAYEHVYKPRTGIELQIFIIFKHYFKVFLFIVIFKIFSCNRIHKLYNTKG